VSLLHFVCIFFLVNLMYLWDCKIIMFICTCDPDMWRLSREGNDFCQK
jgi:hypothetical protein